MRRGRLVADQDAAEVVAGLRVEAVEGLGKLRASCFAPSRTSNGQAMFLGGRVWCELEKKAGEFVLA